MDMVEKVVIKKLKLLVNCIVVLQLCSSCTMHKPVASLCEDRFTVAGIKQDTFFNSDVGWGITAGVLGSLAENTPILLGGMFLLYGGIAAYHYDSQPTMVEQAILHQSEESDLLKLINQELSESGLRSYVSFSQLDVKNTYDKALPLSKLDAFMKRNRLEFVIGVSSNISDPDSDQEVTWRVYDGKNEYHDILTKVLTETQLTEQALVHAHSQQFAEKFKGYCVKAHSATSD